MADIEAIERRLREIESNLAIRDLKACYWSHLDRRDLEAVRSCLASDARIDMEGVAYHTRDEFIDYVARASGRDGVFNLHTGQNPRIAMIGADRAQGNWDALFTSIDVGERLAIQMTGEYVDTYVYREGRWLIDSLTFRQTSFLMQRIDEQGVPHIVSLGRNNTAAFDA